MLNFSSKAFFCSQLMPALWIVLLLPSLRGRDDIFGSVVLGAPDEPELAVAMDLASGKGTDPGVSRKTRSGYSRSRSGQFDKLAEDLCQFDKLAHLTNRQQHRGMWAALTAGVEGAPVDDYPEDLDLDSKEEAELARKRSRVAF